MQIPILATKLYRPPLGAVTVSRSQLIRRLDGGGHGNLTLISAPAGFGKTTLISEWISGCGRPAAWLSLDNGDSNPVRFLTYIVSALRMIAADFGEGLLNLLQSPQPPSIEFILPTLINEMAAAIPGNFILVLDDYHVIDAKPIDNILAFLLEHRPPQMHLVIATREDPNLPLSRYRARNQLNELRAADLRFSTAETAVFFKQVDLNLAAEEIALLETRTEGWIAGLQLAAISMQGHQDISAFIQSFSGSHHFIMDYLLEEVLQQQTETIQNFLLGTSILDRLCGPLCDAVCSTETDGPSTEGQQTLEYLERANLFIIPLDKERRWYRYHHLFAGLLQQRLRQTIAVFRDDPESKVAELHIRASRWYEDNGMEIEAFHHAAAAGDLERAERLIEGKGMPLQFRGGAGPILDWLESLPTTVLDARPSLWVIYASVLTMTGQTNGVEEKLHAAEAVFKTFALDEKTRNMIGHIAAIRALLAAAQNQVEAIVTQSKRALEYLHPQNLAVRTATVWKLGIAYQLQGERAAAMQAYTEAMAVSRTTGNNIISMSAAIGLGNIQESENELHQAIDTYRLVLEMVGEAKQPAACEAYLGMARILYQWNDLDAAELYAGQCYQLAQQMENTCRAVAGEVFLARLKIARNDLVGADALLTKAERIARQDRLTFQIPEIVMAQILILLAQGHLETASCLARQYDLPLIRARVFLAEGEILAALNMLESYHLQMESKHWEDERLKVRILLAITYHMQGKTDKSLQWLSDALMMAETEGFIRIFIDEGARMGQLLSEAAAKGIAPNYTGKLLAEFEAVSREAVSKKHSPSVHPLIEPLSRRELEIIRLIAQGLTNHEIGGKLFLALDTVKGHNRRIFDKLQVQRRTEAVARARELGIL